MAWASRNCHQDLAVEASSWFEVDSHMPFMCIQLNTTVWRLASCQSEVNYKISSNRIIQVAAPTYWKWAWTKSTNVKYKSPSWILTVTSSRLRRCLNISIRKYRRMTPPSYFQAFTILCHPNTFLAPWHINHTQWLSECREAISENQTHLVKGHDLLMMLVDKFLNFYQGSRSFTKPCIFQCHLLTQGWEFRLCRCCVYRNVCGSLQKTSKLALPASTSLATEIWFGGGRHKDWSDKENLNFLKPWWNFQKSGLVPSHWLLPSTQKVTVTGYIFLNNN